MNGWNKYNSKNIWKRRTVWYTRNITKTCFFWLKSHPVKCFKTENKIKYSLKCCFDLLIMLLSRKPGSLPWNANTRFKNYRICVKILNGFPFHTRVQSNNNFKNVRKCENKLSCSFHCYLTCRMMWVSRIALIVLSLESIKYYK